MRVELPFTAMHLQGILRLVDADLAIALHQFLSHAVVEDLRARGCTVLFAPEEGEIPGMAINFVTLGSKCVLMPTGYAVTQAFLEEAGITCHTVDVSEIAKAAGGIGCLTGVLQRQMADA
jgi:N-dimethylarginine dimethylaminohydrolase